MPYSKDQITTAVGILEDNTVNVPEAAEIFGIQEKFFYRLLQQNKFDLQSLVVKSPLFKESRFLTEDIKRVANVYRLQRKSS
jgi:hypothetical protein